MGIVNLSNKMDIWFKICEFCSKIFTLTDCCTMSGSSVCFMKNKHRCTMMRYGVLEYIFSFFFFFLFLRTRNLNIVWHSFDIIDQYYSRVNNMNSIIHQWNGISRAKRAYYFWKLCLYNDDRHSVIVRWRDLCKK